jgi:hypothetical protein
MAGDQPAGEDVVKNLVKFLISAVAVTLMTSSTWAAASKDLQNKVTAYVTPGTTDKQAVITLWMANVNPVLGLTLPFKFSAGTDTLRLDSILTIGGRAANFIMTKPLFKASEQTFLVNMVWSVESTTHKAAPIPAGEGPLMWMFVHTDGKFPVDELRMATIQLPPENVLIYVTDAYATVNPSFELVHKAPPASGKAAKSGK